ncbi:MAG: flavodoxin family protein [Candidatus Heimdallarchaeota archaeon]|nr:flavodoxin family protein [Candidatus Heimdallarchaeota archaeon]MCK4955770.1 flavodoxin family protein [Candidatus Heimdallarchaeota archaeon]
MSKILILNGSPRKKGNTSFLVEELRKMVQDKGHEVEILTLNDYDINPCQGCFWCYKDYPLKCVQNDVMNTLYPTVLDSDVLIFASPIYWFTYSAQLKLFVDRLVALHVNGGHALNGRKFATIFVYGDTNSKSSGVFAAIDSINHMISYFRGDNLGVVHGTGGDKLTVPDNTQLLEKLRELAERIDS